MTKIKAFLVNSVVFLLAIGIALLLAEGIARIFLNRADFVKLELAPDSILGVVPSPSSRAAFDDWGFRNKKVPNTAEIVAVGDSHTYGNTARMVDSWPYVLSRATGRQVYNMGLGGYGPNQYFYLTKTKAVTLKPKTIVWGLYMGDDFENAFSITYGLDYWKDLRILPPQKIEANIWEGPSGDKGIRSIRVWLSRHSLLYQLAFHAGFGGKVNGEYQIKNAAQLYPEYDTVLNLPEKHILEAFRPKGVLFGLDQDSPNVREGMRITFELLKQTNQLCKENGIEFIVVVIPTKETVFSEYLEHNTTIPMNESVDKLISSERAARIQLFDFMKENGIENVDPLPNLKHSVGEGLYAMSAGDMHPGKNGYRVIGESVAAYLQNRKTESKTTSPAN